VTDDLTTLITEYESRGLALVPVPAGKKSAITAGWPDRVFNIRDFRREDNVAFKCGSRSREVVDIDLDCPEAIELADLYLPATSAEFGRPSKPRSHRLYVAVGASFEAFHDPLSAGQTLLELRADGRDRGAHLSLLPPSVTDGERRAWVSNAIEPATVDARALRQRTVWLAVSCLVMRWISPTTARNPGPDFPRLLWEWDHDLARPVYRWLGITSPDAPQRYPRRSSEQDPRDLDLAKMVAAIPNDGGWEEWNSIGLAIYAASKDRGDGYIIFDDFSAKSRRYNPHETAARWKNYERSPPERTGIGKLAKLAFAAGWRPDRSAS
jgi:Primase C terminal 2 (PriCT-2)/Bifunctional DNA primase/polymerase, N-terminal